MRVEFVNSVIEEMKAQDNMFFVTGDLGFNAFEGLREKFPKRFLNAGAAEQNMVSFAAGLAFEGLESWVYSIAPFVTYRCLEQIRNDVCLHNLPVHLVGNGGGYTYGIMGSTHHTLEDIAVLKALPNMHIYMPCSNNHVEACVKQISEKKRPSYLRLGFSGFSSNRQPLEENPETLTRVYAQGGKATIIGVGQGVQVALKALDENLISQDEVSVFGIAKYPLDLKSDQAIINSVHETGRVVLIEEHYRHGSVSESLALELPSVEKFDLLLPEYNMKQSYGSPQFHLKQAGVTPQVLADLLAAQ